MYIRKKGHKTVFFKEKPFLNMYRINIYFRQLQYGFEAREQTPITIESHSNLLCDIVHINNSRHTQVYNCICTK